MEDDVKLHVVMIPWLAFGHMIPFLELSKCLAKRGHRVSFISTPRNIQRLPPIPSHLSHLINFVKFNLPSVDWLPENAEATVDVPLEYYQHLGKLQDGMEEPVRSFLKEQHNPSPHWIVYDFTIYWAPRVAHAFGLRCAFFSVFSAATISNIGPPSVLLASADQPKKKISPEELMVPPPWITIPSNVVFRYHEAVQMIKLLCLLDHDDMPRDYRVGTAFQGCDVVAMRSCIEFEPDWMNLLGHLFQKPIVPVGFLSPSSLVEQQQEENVRRIWEEGEWLDTQSPESTVYVAFGSELILTQQQVSELAFGLELSQLPFVWAYRGDATLLPMGFEDRTRGRGIVRMGWAPQSKFLAHPSVGGILMHGGWGSAIEALSFGKPLIMLPIIADQGLNTRVMEGRKVGVEVARNEKDGSFTRDMVAKALRLVMVESEGEPIRAKAREMQKIFADKVRDDQYIDDLVRYFIDHRRA